MEANFRPRSRDVGFTTQLLPLLQGSQNLFTFCKVLPWVSRKLTVAPLSTPSPGSPQYRPDPGQGAAKRKNRSPAIRERRSFQPPVKGSRDVGLKGGRE